ncbi:sugar ABC transporter substrate-binding protein [Clostridium beijerinckii]|uniref:sugar ABC transporter substrate-binding protein n=1 Tax=Clostridium beijerinckii TaxID=1520 RepID=UPI0002F7694C|nr:sugar ABC transporter substrate-binding protein [Clostridium beijerinckii]
MRFSKKTIAAISMASVLMFSMVGCGSKVESNKTAKNADGSVTLSLWVHETDSPEGQLYKKEVEEFNKANEGKIKVELTQIARTGDASGYDDKVNAAVTTDSLPDVLTVDGPSVAAQAEAGVISPIDDFVDKEDLKDFNKDIIDQGTYKGKLYGLGAMDASVVIFYNKDMLAKAGITAPTSVADAWTLDELYENAKKMTKDDVYGIDMNLKSGGEWNTFAFLPLVQSFGGQIVADDGKTVDGSINSDKSVQALSYIKKLVDDKVVNPTPIDNSFENGKAAMLLSGPWEKGTLDKYPDLKWGIMPYPVAKKGAEAASPCGSWGFYMTKDCSPEKQKAAVELIKFLTNTESCIAMNKANGMPPARATAFDKIDEFKKEPFNIITEQLQNTAKVRPLTPNYPVISDQFSKAITNTIHGMDPKQALDEAVKQVGVQVK